MPLFTTDTGRRVPGPPALAFMAGMDGSEKTKPFVTPLPYLRELGTCQKGKGAKQKGVRDGMGYK